MKISLYLSCLCFCISSFAGETEIVSISDFVSRIKKSDPNLERIVSDNLKKRFLVDLNLPSRQFLLSVSDQYGYAGNDQGRTNRFSAEISKEIIETGTSLSVSQSEIKRPDQTVNVFEIRAEQSLWKNAFGSLNRDQIDINNLELNKVESQVLDAYEDYVATLINDYLDLYQQSLRYDLSRRLYDQSVKLEANIRKRIKKNVADQIDLFKIQMLVAQRKREMILAKAAFTKSSMALGKRLQGDDKTNSRIVPANNLNLADSISDLKIIDVNKAVEKTRAYHIYQQDIQIGNLNNEIAMQGDDADVKLILGYSTDESSRYSVSINRKETLVGVRLDVPLGDSLSRARVEQSKLDFLQAKLEWLNFKIEFENSLNNIKEDILAQQKVLVLNRKRKELSDKVLKDDERLYGLGKLSLQLLIDSFNNTAQNEYDYLSSVMTLNKYTIDWLNLTDQLIAKEDLKASSDSFK